MLSFSISPSWLGVDTCCPFTVMDEGWSLRQGPGAVVLIGFFHIGESEGRLAGFGFTSRSRAKSSTKRNKRLLRAEPTCGEYLAAQQTGGG